MAENQKETSKRGAAVGGTRKGTGRAKAPADGAAEKQPPKTGRGATGANRTAAKQPDLRKDLRDFASGRPSGWGHDDWLNFLEMLQSRGHNVNDRDAIGLALEKERLDLALAGVKGVGPQRRKALVERFGNVWTLRSADAGEIADAAGIKRDLADEIKRSLG